MKIINRIIMAQSGMLSQRMGTKRATRKIRTAQTHQLVRMVP
jgi:hypothetical protein